MIGNNACGSRSLAYGRTSDNVAGLRLLTAAGEAVETGYSGEAPWVRGGDAVLDGVRAVMAAHLGTARTEFDRFGRQVSGYAAAAPAARALRPHAGPGRVARARWRSSPRRR